MKYLIFKLSKIFQYFLSFSPHKPLLFCILPTMGQGRDKEGKLVWILLPFPRNDHGTRGGNQRKKRIQKIFLF
jgi:hypothetical protein